MSAKDFTYDVKELLACVEANPIIWNKNFENHKDKWARRVAWEKIFRQLDDKYDALSAATKRIVESAIIEKWKNVRDTFLRALKNTKGRPKKKYLHHDELLFLQPMFPDIDFNQYCNENVFEFNEPSKHDKDQDSGEEAEIYTHTNLDATDDDSDYEPERKKKTVNKGSFKTEAIDEEEVYEPAKELEIVDVNGSESRVMNEDEAFFASLLPSVVRYNDDERLEFRIKVLTVMKDIRNKRSNGYT